MRIKEKQYVAIDFDDLCSIFGGPVCEGNPDHNNKCIMFNSAKRQENLERLLNEAFELGVYTEKQRAGK